MKMSKQEFEQFFRLHRALLFYANKKKQIIKGIRSVDELKGDLLEKVYELRNYLVKNQKIIDEFVNENPSKLQDEELKMVVGWKQGIKDDFFIVKHEEGRSLFYSPKTKKVYCVHYLNDSFEDMFGSYLPIMVEAWLIPFKGRIMYDSLIAPYNIGFGGRMRKSLKTEYEESILKNGVIDSFGNEERRKTVSDKELLEFYLKSEANRERYREEIEKLRKKNKLLENAYHLEQARFFARDLKKSLKQVGARGYFAVLESFIVASAKGPNELNTILGEVLPKEKLDLVFIFKI